jgi:hypothetical protein
MFPAVLFYSFILQAVWLTTAHGFKHLGPTQSCVSNAGLAKTTLLCFCRGCCSENAAIFFTKKN